MSPKAPDIAVLQGRPPGAPVILDTDGPVSVRQFLDRVALVGARLPVGGPLINLCEHRVSFLVAYAAALAAGRTTLLPASRAPEAVAWVRERQPASSVVDDRMVAQWLSGRSGAAPNAAVAIDPELIAMIGYTSGSTGTPSGHPKRWGTVVQSTMRNADAIRAAIRTELRNMLPWIVGTVPSQHMYGMELTVLLPLLGSMGIHAARPLLPMDVAAALASTAEPRVLVSTPAHLRAIVASGVPLPTVAVTVSATAPLEAELAQAVERATGGVLLEMFGATETCILAHRRTATEPQWTPYRGVRFSAEGTTTRVETPWFPRPEYLQDTLEIAGDGRFALVGRNADLVDVAGKRVSLADLTLRLLRVPGVLDGVIFQPDEGTGLVRRLAALVVAPGLTPEQIRSQLAPAIDPVFMPRPLVLVPALPRTDAGKLPRAALHAGLAAALDAG